MPNATKDSQILTEFLNRGLLTHVCLIASSISEELAWVAFSNKTAFTVEN